MTKYEYKILEQAHHKNEMVLNKLGKEGWKIVGVSGDSYNILSIIMMREIPNNI